MAIDSKDSVIIGTVAADTIENNKIDLANTASAVNK